MTLRASNINKQLDKPQQLIINKKYVLASWARWTPKTTEKCQCDENRHFICTGDQTRNLTLVCRNIAKVVLFRHHSDDYQNTNFAFNFISLKKYLQ